MNYYLYMYDRSFHIWHVEFLYVFSRDFAIVLRFSWFSYTDFIEQGCIYDFIAYGYIILNICWSLKGIYYILMNLYYELEAGDINYLHQNQNVHHILRNCTIHKQASTFILLRSHLIQISVNLVPIWYFHFWFGRDYWKHRAKLEEFDQVLWSLLKHQVRWYIS